MILVPLSFPHVPRFIFVTLYWTLLWLLLALLILANIFANKTIAYTTLNASSILLHPFLSDSHLNLAHMLWAKGETTEAKREAMIAADLHGNDSVLGTTIEANTVLSTWEAEPAKMQKAYDFWIHITQTYSDYADGFVYAASYAYQLGNITEAKNLISHAQELNPTSPTIQQFAAVMK